MGFMDSCLRFIDWVISLFQANNGHGRSQRVSEQERLVVKYKRIEPHQAGWLRRRELETPELQVWEHPDGRLFAHPKDAPPLAFIKAILPDDQPASNQKIH